MKKLLIISLLGLQAILFVSAEAQVLNVKRNEQLYDQWCWAGCSKTILEYYGFTTPQQCDIAEYVRKVATFHNFGSVNCCTSAKSGCNYWNYGFGSKGSIQDILVYFGKLQNVGLNKALSLAEINTEMKANRLFVARWGWSGGGGHFVVGHGVQGDNIYYMNPWFGEGLLIGTYSWFKQGKTSNSSTHTWTDTNKLTGTALGVDESTSAEPISVSPNPFVYETTLRSDKNFNAATLTIYNALGQEMKQIKNISDQTVTIHRDNLPRGMYFIRVTEGNKTILTDKLLVTD